MVLYHRYREDLISLKNWYTGIILRIFIPCDKCQMKKESSMYVQWTSHMSKELGKNSVWTPDDDWGPSQTDQSYPENVWVLKCIFQKCIEMGYDRKANAEHLMACANLFRAVGFDLMFPVCYVRVSSVHEVFCPGYLQFLYLHLSFVCLDSNLPLNWWCNSVAN